MDNGPHNVNNKVIDPRKAKNRSQTRSECKKIFLGGLDANLPEKDIRAIFSKYGKIENVELPFDTQNQCRRRFGFVVFETSEAADAACKEPKQMVGPSEVDVRISKPNNTGSRQFFNNGQQRARGGYGNGNGMMYMNNDGAEYNSNRMNVYNSYENGQNRYMDTLYRVHRY